MDGAKRKDAKLAALLAAALDGTLTDSQAEEMAAFDADPVKLVLLVAVKHIAEQGARIADQEARIAELKAKLQQPPAIDPATPSGQRPVYTKPPAPQRRNKPGAKKGHPGRRRPHPKRIDERQTHRLDRCPNCGGRLQRCKRTRTRTIEDILRNLRTVVTEHTIHRDYCPRCRRHVEPVVPDALPNANIGHRLTALTAWLHCGVGVTISQVRQILSYHLQTRLSAGGLVAGWQRLARLLEAWYEQICQEARASGVLHADETGWRMNGLTWWLWCFVARHVCCYMIDRCRGSPALAPFFMEALDGVLVTDFWAAYNALRGQVGDRQCCLAHLLRELERVDERNPSAAWKAFGKKLRRLVRDGIRLRKRLDFDPQRYASRIRRMDERLMAMAQATYADADAARLAKPLLKHCDQLFTFLDYPEVPYENNLAERMIRPAVILRKNSQSNRSGKGAATQAVLL